MPTEEPTLSTGIISLHLRLVSAINCILWNATILFNPYSSMIYLNFVTLCTFVYKWKSEFARIIPNLFQKTILPLLFKFGDYPLRNSSHENVHSDLTRRTSFWTTVFHEDILANSVVDTGHVNAKWWIVRRTLFPRNF